MCVLSATIRINIIDILRKEARKKSRAQALTEGLKNVLKMNVMKQP